MLIPYLTITQQFKQNAAQFFKQSCRHLSKQDIFVGLILSSLMINLLGLVLPFTIIQFYDRVIPNKAYNTFYAFVIIVCIGLIIEAGLKIMRGFISSSLDVKIGYSMSLQAYKTVLNADLIEFEREPFSVYIDRFNTIDQLREYYSGQYLITMCDIPFVFFYFSFIYCIQVYVGISITIVCLILLAISYLHASQFKINQLQKTKTVQMVSKFLVELIHGLNTVKTIGLEEQMLRRYERLQKSHIQREFNIVQQKMAASRNINIVAQIMIMVTVMVSCYTIFKNQMSIGGMAACILLAGKVMQPISTLVSLFLRWKNFEMADQEFNKLTAITSENHSNLKKINIVAGEIILDNLNYYHLDPNGNKIMVFEGLRLDIPAKQTIAIHGDGLSGKSTLINILAGLFRIKEGEFLIDGEDLNNVDLDYLRNQIAIISPRAYLFQGTILENLTRFVDNVDLNTVYKVCMDIGLHSLIQAMPDGYQTVITDTNTFLIQSVKQSIVIARELLKDPKIILFDEPDLEVDLETDFLVHNMLSLKKGHVTMVIVSYRSSLLSMADQHYVIQGRKLIKINGT